METIIVEGLEILGQVLIIGIGMLSILFLIALAGAAWRGKL